EWTAGLMVYSLEVPTNPRKVAFYPVKGAGVHRMTYWEAPYVYMTATDDGYSEQFLVILDLSDLSHPQEVGRWAFPGMHLSDGEQPTWGDDMSVMLHHALV